MDQLLLELDGLLSEPLESVRERERSAFDRLLAGRNGRLVLFGAGNLGRKALECLGSSSIEPLAFADNAPAKWGTRVDALQGANGQRPLLSICIYHLQSDLWRIPLFIRSLASDYKFFLRLHDGDGGQLVCYAVPVGRLRA
jgi:hypothetical protein